MKRLALFILAILAAAGTGYYLHSVTTRDLPSLPNLVKGTPQAETLQQSFVTVAERVRPAVVNIGTVQHSRGRNPFSFTPFEGDPNFKEFFEHFFGQGSGPREFKRPSLGSGVIIDKKGYILTNFHVIKGADEITVRLASKKEFKGKVVGTDIKTDLAVIRIEPDGDLTVAPLGNSDALKVGQFAIAIGNPFGLDQTVTVGVISATGRADVGIATYENFIQTDASINPGNSGGPLLSLNGEVIGINTAIVAAAQGIGFAIPINMVKRISSQLIERGKVVRGWLGLSVQPVTPELARSLGVSGTGGAVVGQISPESPAAEAGIQQGDLILKFEGAPLEDYHHFQRLTAEAEVGKTVRLHILRKKRPLDVTVKVVEGPGDSPRKGSP